MTVTAPRAASSSTWTAAANDSATTPGRRLRGADLLSAAACTVAGPAFLSLADRLAGTAPQTGTARLEQLLALGCAALGLLLCLAWAVALVSTALWVVAARRGSRHADVLARFSPALLRRLAAAAFGIHIALAPGAAADDAPLRRVASGAARLRADRRRRPVRPLAARRPLAHRPGPGPCAPCRHLRPDRDRGRRRLPVGPGRRRARAGRHRARGRRPLARVASPQPGAHR